MKVFQFYLSRTVISGALLVMAVLLSLAGFMEFIGQLDDLGEGRYGIPHALLYVLLKLPTVGFVMLPIGVLIGALLSLGNLANRSELIALRAAGVSPAQLATGALVAGVVLGLFTLLLGEYIGPPAERFARHYRGVTKFGEAMPRAGPSSWIRDGNVFLNVVWPSEEQPAGGVFLFRVQPGAALEFIGRADALEPDESAQWVLQNYAETQFLPDSLQASRQSTALQAVGLNPDLLGLTVLRPNTLDGRALLRYVEYLKRNDLDAREYEVEFWVRIASSVSVMLMCVLAVPFVLGPLRRAGNSARMLLGVVVGLGYFLVSRALADGGEVWDLSPLTVAWAPTLFLAVATVWILARAR